MPNEGPLRPRAKAIRREHAETERAETSIDWLALWAISIGISAAVIAAIAYFSAADRTGAAMVLAGAAALIAIVLRANARGYF
jgi:hypothetical protein